MKTTRLDDLPLYADDDAIGAAIVGPKRACEWKALVPMLEKEGLPQIDKFHGGRYVPGVKTFYEHREMHNQVAPLAPKSNDGEEHPEAWTRRKSHRA